MRADAELPWYFGSGASTWAGDAGLRSPIGGQLAAASQVKQHRVENPPWMAKGVQAFVVDASKAEDEMLARTTAALIARRIATRLACLTRVQVQALELHYDESKSLPFGIDASAILLVAARRLVVGPQVHAHYREAIGAVRAAHAFAASRNLAAAHDELGRFILARGKARALRRARGPVDIELLRRALHDAPEDQRKAIEDRASSLVQKAKAAYEAVEVLGDDRRVQVEDPRRNRA